jgi:hypothetical protein
MRLMWMMVFSATFALFLMLGQGSLTNAVGADRKGSARQVENTEEFKEAKLFKRERSMLYFDLKKKDTSWKIWGHLTDKTRIVDEKGQALGLEHVREGSVWDVTLGYPMEEDTIPAIVLMRMVQEGPPE